MLAWSLAALWDAERIGSIVVAAPPGELEEFRRLCETAVQDLPEDGAGAESPITVVEGGASRAESVAAGLEAVTGDLVAIHDAARPLITAAMVDRAVAMLEDAPGATGAIVAAPVADTLKRSSGGDGSAAIAETVDRRDLWAAQTPQVFRVDQLREAQARAAAEGELESATDEAMLIEALGAQVLICPADGPNLKVTTRDDLEVAEALLAARS